jgi:hypothetical protein
MRTFHVSTSATTIYNVRGVSAFDAALRCVTRLASKGGLPHGVPVTVRVHDGEAEAWIERPAKHVDVTVTPTGRTLADEVAA